MYPARPQNTFASAPIDWPLDCGRTNGKSDYALHGFAMGCVQGKSHQNEKPPAQSESFSFRSIRSRDSSKAHLHSIYSFGRTHHNNNMLPGNTSSSSGSSPQQQKVGTRLDDDEVLIYVRWSVESHFHPVERDRRVTHPLRTVGWAC